LEELLGLQQGAAVLAGGVHLHVGDAELVARGHGARGVHVQRAAVEGHRTRRPAAEPPYSGAKSGAS
jgi:hypothetical protein